MKKYLVWVLLLVSLGLNAALLIRILDRPEKPVWRRDMGPHGHAVGPRAGNDGPGPRDGGERPDGSGGMGEGRRFTGLDLSEDQHERLQELRGGWQVQMDPLRRDMQTLFAEMRDLLTDESIDRERVGAARRRLAAIRAEVDSLVSEHLLEELELLTPEQRDRYLERMPWERFGGGARGRGRR